MEVVHQSCRTCLRELNNMFYNLDHVEQFEDITLMTKLLACVPEMKLDSSNTCICFSCTATLRLAYEFRKMCLTTETQIQNENQNQIPDSKIFISEQPIVKTESEIKVEENYLDEDEDDWLRANGYFNTNSDEKDTDIDDVFEETDTAESDPDECIPYNPPPQKLADETSHHTNTEVDAENIIRKSCENIEFLKERNITPKNLKCQVAIEKLPESYSYVAIEDMTSSNVEKSHNIAIEDMTSSNVENDLPNKFYSCDRCKKRFSNFTFYQNHMKYKSIHNCEFCSLKYCSKLAHLNHMKTHKEKIIECRYCNRVFFNQKSYGKHKVYHKNRSCLNCNLHFKTRKQLYRHKEEHKKQDSVTKENEYASMSSTSEEQFRRIVVSEDEFEKAVKSFSTEFFDENDNPPIIEKYCCSGNCNCANKKSNNSDSSNKLRSILPLKGFDNDFLFATDSVRKSKEIAKKNIKNMSRVESRKRIQKQKFNGNEIVSEHNYCKKYSLSKKGQKEKHLINSTTPENFNVTKGSCEKPILQQIELTNTIQKHTAIDDAINEEIITINNENAKKSINEGDVPRTYLKVKDFTKTDRPPAHKELDINSETNFDSSKQNNKKKTSYGKIYLQKTSTESLGINNMSLADLLKDTVNVNSKFRQSSNSDVVTLKDLLDNLDNTPSSLHVVTPFNGTVTNYIFPNSIDLTEQLNIVADGEKARPKILKEVYNKNVTNNLSPQSQLSTTNVPFPDNTLQRRQLKVVPNHHNEVPTEYRNNLQSTALDSSKNFDMKPILTNSNTIGSDKDKLVDTLETNHHSELPNKVKQIGVSTNESQQINFFSSNRFVVPNIIKSNHLFLDSFALHLPISSANDLVNTFAPTHKHNRMPNSQECPFKIPPSSELNSTSFPNTNLNQSTSEKCMSSRNLNSTTFSGPVNETIPERNVKPAIFSNTNSVVINEEPKNRQKESTSVPTTLKVAKKLVESDNNDPTLKKMITRFPAGLNCTYNKENKSNSDKPTICTSIDSTMTNVKPANHTTPLPTTLKYTDNEKSSGYKNKLNVGVYNDSALISNRSVNKQNKSLYIPTTLKYADNQNSSDNKTKPPGSVNNDPALTSASPMDLQTEPTFNIEDIISLLESDSDDTVTKCGTNDDVSNKVDNVVDLTTETDTFSVNFNYLRNQIQGSPQINHGIRVKSFAKEKRPVTATVTTQSTVEKSNINSHQTMPESLKVLVVSEITPSNPENVPENLESTVPNVEVVDLISGSEKDITRVDNLQKENHLDKTPSEEESAPEKSLDDPIDVISLAKRNYDREIKKLFNLTFKPLSPTTKKQKSDDIQNKEQETKSDYSNKDEQTIQSNTKTSLNVYETRSRGKHITEETRDNEAQSHSSFRTNSVEEKEPLINNNENRSDQLSPTLDGNTYPSRYNVHVFNRKSSGKRGKLNSIVQPLASCSFTRKTFDKKENFGHESTTTTEANNVAEYSSIVEEDRFEKIPTTNVQTTSEECSSETSFEKHNSMDYIVKQNENKSSNQNVKMFAINENASTSRQQLADESLCEQAEPTTSKECNSEIQQNKFLSNLDFELFHSRLNEGEQKKMRLVNSKSKIRPVQEKCPLKEIENEKVEDSADVTITQDITDGDESKQVGTTERKGKFPCRICKKYFEYSFQRELHECQFSFARSTRKTTKDVFCERCENVFTNEILKNLHVCQVSRLSRKNGRNQSVKSSCAICNKVFSSCRLLCLHLKDAHEKSNEVSTKSIPSGIKQRCFICKQIFKNGLYRFLHLLRHFSFQKHKCRNDKGIPQKQTEYKRQSGKLRKYKLSELSEVLQIGNINKVTISKYMQKKAFSKMLNYLHLVRCRKCNRISGGWINGTSQNYITKWRYFREKTSNGKATINNSRPSSTKHLSTKSVRNYGLQRKIRVSKTDEGNKTVQFYRKRQNPRKRKLKKVKKMTSKQILIRQQMLRVMGDLGLSAKEMNFYTLDALKNESYQESDSSKSTGDHDTLSSHINNRLHQLLTKNKPQQVTLTNNKEENKIEENTEVIVKRHTCKYCLLEFESKLTLKLHKNTPLHRQNVALLQKSENEIEQELLRSVDQPQTLEDVERAIKYTMDKIKMIKKYHCEVCNNSFISRNQLEMHRNMHKKELFKGQFLMK